jgi:hypothetical protein
MRFKPWPTHTVIRITIHHSPDFAAQDAAEAVSRQLGLALGEALWVQGLVPLLVPPPASFHVHGAATVPARQVCAALAIFAGGGTFDRLEAVWGATQGWARAEGGGGKEGGGESGGGGDPLRMIARLTGLERSLHLPGWEPERFPRNIRADHHSDAEWFPFPVFPFAF